MFQGDPYSQKYKKPITQPTRTVLFLSKYRGRNGLGASFELISQNGVATGHIHPITIIAMIPGLRHPPFAVAASVSGIRTSDMAAERSKRPIISNSYQRTLRTEPGLCPFQGGGGSIPTLAALRRFKNNANASGRKAAGSTMVQRP